MIFEAYNLKKLYFILKHGNVHDEKENQIEKFIIFYYFTQKIVMLFLSFNTDFIFLAFITNTSQINLHKSNHY